ncbi:MAG TPA: efflux transporter outer membrane subunit [Verrucomicrobiae bacterium]|nr:efflux transporter outer membrane subunit [Verrucomicrobiae bacterium]
MKMACRQPRAVASLARLCAVGMIAGAAGCAVGPDYKRPDAVAKMPPTYAYATNGWKVAEPQAHVPKGNWWEIFRDPELNELEAQASAANQQLRAAVASFDQARAAADFTRSQLFPQIGISPSVVAHRNSANQPFEAQPAGVTNTFPYGDIIAPLNMSWELDLWGRVRRSLESARAQQQATADDLEAVKLSIQAEVATDYFTLRALDADADLLKSNIDVFGKSFELTQNRRTGGVASDLDVAQAETVLRTTEAELPATLLQRAQFEHALAVLAGQPASTFAIARRPLGILPPAIPSGVPSELLERRPDIAAAERRIAAANASVGVAKGAFFPAIQLNGLAGFESLHLGSLFDWQSRFWSLGPSLTMPLFDAGQNSASLRAARAGYQQAVANYRETVLAAFQDVEDNLAAQLLLTSQSEAEAAAVEAALKQFKIADNRYRAGLVTFLDVATAENTALDIERTAVQLRGQQLVAAVSLIRSLGGGWQAPTSPSSAASR